MLRHVTVHVTVHFTVEISHCVKILTCYHMLLLLFIKKVYTQFCRIKGFGGSGRFGGSSTNNFRKTQVTPTNYISPEREFIGESESF